MCLVVRMFDSQPKGFAFEHRLIKTPYHLLINIIYYI